MQYFYFWYSNKHYNSAFHWFTVCSLMEVLAVKGELSVKNKHNQSEINPKKLN